MGVVRDKNIGDVVVKAFLCCICMLLGGNVAAEQPGDKYEAARKKLAYNHLHDKGIENQKVLDTIFTVKRHLFFPEKLWPMVYQDIPLPLKQGYYAIEPSIVALIADNLALNGEERVLVVGTREGYLCAILALLAKAVYTVETDYALYRQAEIGFYAHKLFNIWMRLSSDYFAWQDGIRFDCIVVNGALPEIPLKLLDLLKEGGILILPLGDQDGFQELVRIKKKNGNREKQILKYVMFPPL
ncbi:MAG: protein-L-isoaspartate O-methyltransferase [Spirochaetales bacterium]|nr:protein-L-isoaspartate O-methyltransferase [Spirochaetales bacterium]